MNGIPALARRRRLAAAAVPALAAALLAAGCSAPQGGYGLMARQASDEAIARQQAAGKEPAADNRGMYLSLIREMQDKGLYFASLAHIDAFEQKYGAAPDVELLRGHALREAGQPAESQAVYRRLLDSEVAAAASQGLGLLAAARGDYPAAVAAFKEAARRDPTNALIVSDLGYALLRQGDTRAARLPIAQAAELAPDNPRILGNLALLLLVSGDPGRAEAVMKKADLSPQMRQAVRSMASEMLAQREPAVAGPVPEAKPASGPAPMSAPMPRPVRAAVVRQVPAVSAPAAIGSVRDEGSAMAGMPTDPETPMPMQTMLDRFGSSGP
ncbi:hypothetical protein GCM10023144_26850 [Pigmentiphaga soli]|uniref:Pilus assembly protein n=1 Tax=Pigmentiphaga soli TaxID=1007095 RepID=A0ABP8H562_9BURK